MYTENHFARNTYTHVYNVCNMYTYTHVYNVCNSNTYTHMYDVFKMYIIHIIHTYCDLQSNRKFDRPFKNGWMRGIPIQGPFFAQLRKQELKKEAQNRFVTGGQMVNYFASQSTCVYIHTSVHVWSIHESVLCTHTHKCTYIHIYKPETSSLFYFILFYYAIYIHLSMDLDSYTRTIHTCAYSV
jgi:hypothetical protein